MADTRISRVAELELHGGLTPPEMLAQRWRLLFYEIEQEFKVLRRWIRRSGVSGSEE